MIPWFYDSIPLSIKTQRNWSQLTLLHEETEGTNCLAWYKQILLLEFLVRLYRRANSDLQLERSPPFLLHLSMRTTQTKENLQQTRLKSFSGFGRCHVTWELYRMWKSHRQSAVTISGELRRKHGILQTAECPWVLLKSVKPAIEHCP